MSENTKLENVCFGLDAIARRANVTLETARAMASRARENGCGALRANGAFCCTEIELQRLIAPANPTG